MITLEDVGDLPIIWVREKPCLLKLLADLDDSYTYTVALDTEFIKRSTYLPTLALIQINTGNAIYLVDAPRLDLDPLWESLVEVPLTVWHACSEDLNIFYLLSGMPPVTNVFDTQLAMAYLTGNLQVGYQSVVEEKLGVYLEKAHSQSNWLARPLNDEQENYAADDVRYLLPLYYQLEEQLIEANLYDYVVEDSQVLAYELYQNFDDSDGHQYLSNVSSSHSGVQRYLLKELLSWREYLARITNQPRTFILRKQGVKDILIHMPKSMKDLKHHTCIHRSIISNYGSEILQMVAQAKKVRAGDHPPEVTINYLSRDKKRQDLINQFIETYAEKIKVPANLIMKKKWQSALIQLINTFDDSDTPYTKEQLPLSLRGWRYQWVVDEFIPVLKEYHKQAKVISLSGIY